MSLISSAFLILARHNRKPRLARKDTFFISVTASNFSYSNGGFITDGNIQIHKE